MSSVQLEQVIARIASMQSAWTETTDMQTMRNDLERLHTSFGGVDSATVESVDANGVAADYVCVPEAGADRDILYLHGGGFAVCSAKSHRHLAQWLAAAASARVLVVDYRLVPEFCFPSQLNDARAAYDWLLEQGTSPAKVSVAGDSAGAGLTLALLAMLRDEGAQLPASACLMSAWADLRCTGLSYESIAEADPVATRDMALQMGEAYVGGDATTFDHPYASPVKADYTGFPPIMLQAGTRDIFLDDSRAVAALARQVGVRVELKEWPGMIHQWQMFAAVLDEGRESLAQIGAFIKKHG